jgi:hypothetical protein
MVMSSEASAAPTKLFTSATTTSRSPVAGIQHAEEHRHEYHVSVVLRESRGLTRLMMSDAVAGPVPLRIGCA